MMRILPPPGTKNLRRFLGNAIPYSVYTTGLSSRRQIHRRTFNRFESVAEIERVESRVFGTNQVLVNEIRGLFSQSHDAYTKMIDRLDTDASVTDISVDIGGQIKLFSNERSIEVLDSDFIENAHMDAMLTEFAPYSQNYPDLRGMYGTLHRVSFHRDFAGWICGLTIRIGRSFDIFENIPGDLMNSVASGKSVVIHGPPVSGKTTMLRNVSEFCADHLLKRVVVVDDTGELRGHVHPCANSIGVLARTFCFANSPNIERSILDFNPDIVIFDDLTEKSARIATNLVFSGVTVVSSIASRSATARTKQIDTSAFDVVFDCVDKKIRV
jgi:stage III sporulation protein SpoIIIAA